jgi:hypothetical protein
MKLLDLPKEEQKAVTEAIKGKKLSSYDLDSKVRERLFWRLMEAKAAVPDESYGQEDIEFFIENKALASRYGGEMGKNEKKIFKLFMGYEYDGDVKKLLSLAPWGKLCALITALHMGEYEAVPGIEEFENGKDLGHLGWFPVSTEEVRKMYQEEIRALLPKPKAEKKAAPKGKEKRGKPA